MRLTTVVLVIALIIIGLYAATEVSYYSNKIANEEQLESPVVIIPSIGVNEKINNQSTSQGVYHENLSKTPTEGDVILFGHRTLYGSPFLRLNELQPGDNIVLEWPGIGEVNYTISDSKVVPANYSMEVKNDSQKLYLITCHPIGSTEDRLIYEANLSNVGEINQGPINENPQEHFGLIICIGFLVIGLTLCYFYPAEDRLIILIAVLIISAFLFYAYISPQSLSFLTSQIESLNQIIRVGS